MSPILATNYRYYILFFSDFFSEKRKKKIVLAVNKIFIANWVSINVQCNLYQIIHVYAKKGQINLLMF